MLRGGENPGPGESFLLINRFNQMTALVAEYTMLVCASHAPQVCNGSNGS